MLNIKQWAVVSNNIMNVPGMALHNDSGVAMDSGHARDNETTRLRFNSNKGINDAVNGESFVKFMRGAGYTVDARSPRAVTVKDSDLVEAFNNSK